MGRKPRRWRADKRGGSPLAIARDRVIWNFERRYVEAVLAKHGGNVGAAARASGVAHRYFQLVRARVR